MGTKRLRFKTKPVHPFEKERCTNTCEKPCWKSEEFHTGKSQTMCVCIILGREKSQVYICALAFFPVGNVARYEHGVQESSPLAFVSFLFRNFAFSSDRFDDRTTDQNSYDDS